tara:strand:- start:3425 stop:4909 length:1485 start_codon:yes stop_codon:yes gene_type:complete
MSMSGKTFLAAFQVGSNIVPDAIENALRRGKLDEEKVTLELQNELRRKERDRIVTSDESLQKINEGISRIEDFDSPEAADTIKNLMQDNVFGVSQYKPNFERLTSTLKNLDQVTGMMTQINSDIEQKKILKQYQVQNPAEMLDFQNYLLPNGNIDYSILPANLKQKIKSWYYENERFSELRAKSLIPKNIERGIFGGLTSEEKGDLRTALKDVKKEKTVAQYIQSKQEFDQIRTLVNRAQKEGRTLKGPQDISIVFKFMKALDPESVVREGEFATAANAGGIPVKVTNFYNKIIEGQLLTPELRDSFIDAARDAVEGKKSQAVSTVQSYIGENEKLLPKVQDIPRYFEDILDQIESPLVEVEDSTKSKMSTVVTEDIGPFLSEEEANIYLQGLTKEGKPLPSAVKVRDRLIAVPRAENYNNKLNQQPSPASMMQSIDDLSKRKLEVEEELKQYKGNLFQTERKAKLQDELVEIDAAIRNLNQAKDPDASPDQTN